MSGIEQVDIEDFLAFWAPLADEEITEDYLDWGPVAPGSSQDRLVRVRNCSPTYWALDVVVSGGTTGGVWQLVSGDESSFGTSVGIGDLAPLSVSAPITVRRVVAPTAVGDGSLSLTAITATWSQS